MPFTTIIREKDLKERLVQQSFHSVMKYAREKERKIKHRGLKSLYRRFTLLNKVDYEYAFLLSLLFAAEYIKIKERVAIDPNMLVHISYDAYWNDCRQNVGQTEAIFLSYTYFSEKYPEMSETFVKFDEIMANDSEKDLIELAIDHLKNRKYREAETCT